MQTDLENPLHFVTKIKSPLPYQICATILLHVSSNSLWIPIPSLVYNLSQVSLPHMAMVRNNSELLGEKIVIQTV